MIMYCCANCGDSLIPIPAIRAVASVEPRSICIYCGAELADAIGAWPRQVSRHQGAVEDWWYDNVGRQVLEMRPPKFPLSAELLKPITT